MGDARYYTREEVNQLLKEQRDRILREINDTIIFNSNDPGQVSTDKSLFFKFIKTDSKK